MDLTQRSATELFDDHLRLAQEGDFEADCARNIAADIVVLTWTTPGSVRSPFGVP